MNKKTKLIIGGLGLVALFLAYKKGMFGGKSSSGPSGSEILKAEIDPNDETVTVTPTGDPQGIVVNMLPNNFSQFAPVTESYA
jgi:hypothetical protein